MSTGTPRDLDPKFKDATIPTNGPDNKPDPAVKENPKKDTTEETPHETLKRLQSTEIPKDPGEGSIVFKRQVVNAEGKHVEEVHGPMPVSEWATYSAEKGL